MTLQDWLGNTISIGDYIVYPCRASSHLWINGGTVVEIGEDENQWGKKQLIVRVKTDRSSDKWQKFSGKIQTLTALNRITKVGSGLEHAKL